MRKERNRTRVSDKVRERWIRTCLYGLNVRSLLTDTNNGFVP